MEYLEVVLLLAIIIIIIIAGFIFKVIRIAYNHNHLKPFLCKQGSIIPVVEAKAREKASVRDYTKYDTAILTF